MSTTRLSIFKKPSETTPINDTVQEVLTTLRQPLDDVTRRTYILSVIVQDNLDPTRDYLSMATQAWGSNLAQQADRLPAANSGFFSKLNPSANKAHKAYQAELDRFGTTSKMILEELNKIMQKPGAALR